MSKLPENLIEAARACASKQDMQDYEIWHEEIERQYFEYIAAKENDPIKHDPAFIKAVKLIDVYSTFSPLFRELSRRLQTGEAVARGRIGTLSNDDSEIPKEYWKGEALIPPNLIGGKPDFVYWPETPDRQVFNVFIANEIHPNNISNPRNAGRPEKYAWDAAIDMLLIQLCEKGMPDTQGELTEIIQEIFEQISGEKPADSTIKEYFKKRYPKFFGKCKAKPDA